MKKNWLVKIKGAVLLGVAVVCVMASVKDVKADASGNCGTSGHESEVTWSYVDNNKTLTISGSGNMANYEESTVPWRSHRDDIKKVEFASGSTIKSIGENAFVDCQNLTSIEIPNSVENIKSNAFKGCKSLTSITIPNSVKKIGISSFDHCESLTSIIIPNSVEKIETQAFQYCKGLTSITIPNRVTEIENHTFDGCSELKSITIQNGVKKIGSYAFNICSNLTSITIPNSVNTIKDYAFRECTSLTSITIPSGVTTIKGGILFGCSKLETIIFEGNPNSISGDAFSYALNGDEYTYLKPKTVEFGKNVSKATIEKILTPRTGPVEVGVPRIDTSQITKIVVPDKLINDLKDVASLVSIKEKFVKYSTEHPDPEPVSEKSEQEEQQTASEGTPTGPSKSVYEEKMDSLVKEINALMSSTTSTSTDNKSAGGTKTLYLKDVSSLSLSVMKALKSNPNVNLDMTYTYKGIAFHVVIPAGTAVFDDSIPWYGPLWLYAHYGQGTLTDINNNNTNVYIVQRGDTLRKIAAKYGMTLEELIKKNPQIKNIDKISIGDKIFY